MLTEQSVRRWFVSHKSAGGRPSRSDIGHGRRAQETYDANGSVLVVTIWQQLDATGVICLYDEDKDNVENDNEDNDNEDHKDNDNDNEENATDANGTACCDNSWTQPASFDSTRKKVEKYKNLTADHK